ncbi:MAG: hypothetical protein ACT4PW_07725 [Acidimicrobiia bacterium]
MSPRIARSVAALLAAATAVVGCGDGDDGEAAQSPASAGPAGASTSTTRSTGSESTEAPGSEPEPATPATASTPPSPEPVQAQRTPEAALEAWFADQDQRYAGDCSGTDLGSDVGAYCSVLERESGPDRVYKVGPTFSEFTTWVVVRAVEDGWSVVGSASVGTSEEPLPPPG